jgi:hypothetical protein
MMLHGKTLSKDINVIVQPFLPLSSKTVGVNGAYRFLFRLMGLTLSHMFNAAKERADVNGQNSPRPPTIYADVSWLDRYVSKQHGRIVGSAQIIGCLKS